MNWIEQVTVLELLVKGLIIGVVVSAPMGPVGVLCLQRTLRKGRLVGLATGIGASLSDIAYALLTGYGMSFMDEFLTRNRTALEIIGSVMLFCFGVYAFRSNPVKSFRSTPGKSRSLWGYLISAFFITFSNPLIIFLFIGLFARFSFVMPGSPIGFQLEGYLAILAGAELWWIALTFMVDKLRRRFNVRGVWVMNRVIGSLVMLASAISFVYTIVLGNSFY